MNIEAVEIGSHKIARVTVRDDAAFMARAREQAMQKAAYIGRADPDGRLRLSNEMQSQNLLGVVADMACARVMESYFAKHKMNIGVTRYDDVRTDGFRDHDQYDVRLSSGSNAATVEVRSSVCALLGLPRMIRDWQILGWYTSTAKGNTEAPCDFYIRPIFHFVGAHGTYTRAQGAAALENGELDLYIVGGATRKMLEENGRDDQGATLKQESASYRVIDILAGLDCHQFLMAVAGHFGMAETG